MRPCEDGESTTVERPSDSILPVDAADPHNHVPPSAGSPTELVTWEEDAAVGQGASREQIRQICAAAAQRHLTAEELNEFKRLLKAVNAGRDLRLPNNRRRADHALRRLVALAGIDPNAPSPGTVQRRFDAGDSPASTTRRVAPLTLAEMPNAEHLIRFRQGTATTDEWIAALAPTPRRSVALTSISALIVADPITLSPRDQRLSEFAVLRRTRSAPAAMREMLGKDELSKADRQLQRRLEQSLRDEGQVTSRHPGQRTWYRIVPLIELLLLEGFIGHRGAKATALLDRAIRELQNLRPKALARGVRMELAGPSVQSPTDDDVFAAAAAHTVRVALPTPRTVQRYLHRLPAALCVARTHGVRTVARQMRPIDAYSNATVANEVWLVDHTRLDVLVRIEELTADGATRHVASEVYLTTILDSYCRFIIAFHLSVLPPSAAHLSRTMYHALRPWPGLGRHQSQLPVALKVDRGADFQSKAFERVLRGLGIERDDCRPRMPDDKAAVERLFRTLHDALSAVPGYLNTPGTDKKTLERRPDLLWTLEALHAHLERACHTYNTTPHGLTRRVPVAEWHEQTTRPAPEGDALILQLLRSTEVRTISHGVVRFANRLYSGNLTDERGRTLLELSGTKVRLHYVENDLGTIHLFTARDDDGPEPYLGAVYPQMPGVPNVDLETQSREPLAALKHTVRSFTKTTELRNHEDSARQLAARREADCLADRAPATHIAATLLPPPVEDAAPASPDYEIDLDALLDRVADAKLGDHDVAA